MQRPLDWIAPVLASPLNGDGGIGPFGLAEPRASRRLFEEAGFRDVDADAVDRMIPIGESLSEAVEMLTMAGAAARVMHDASEEDRRRAEDLLRAGLAEIVEPDGAVRLPAACWIYSGRA